MKECYGKCDRCVWYRAEEGAVSAVAQYLLRENKVMRFEYSGKKYKLCVVEVQDGT